MEIPSIFLAFTYTKEALWKGWSLMESHFNLSQYFFIGVNGLMEIKLPLQIRPPSHPKVVPWDQVFFLLKKPLYIMYFRHMNREDFQKKPKTGKRFWGTFEFCAASCVQEAQGVYVVCRHAITWDLLPLWSGRHPRLVVCHGMPPPWVMCMCPV